MSTSFSLSLVVYGKVYLYASQNYLYVDDIDLFCVGFWTRTPRHGCQIRRWSWETPSRGDWKTPQDDEGEQGYRYV